MPTGNTITDSLADSLPTMIAQAITVREHKGVMTRLADRVSLGVGMGTNWNEVSLAKLTATAITETTEEDNPQQISDSIQTLTPSVISVHTVITDRTTRAIAQNVASKIGGLAQNAIERKKDVDGLTALDGATTSLAGAGTTLTSGHVAAGAYRIRGNTTEPWDGPVSFVLHGFQMKDLFDELIAGVGTSVVDAGPTASVYQRGFNLPIADARGYTDGNITIDGSDDAKGGVFASGKGGALILVQARVPWMKVLRNEKLGGGATEVLQRDEYAWGERSAGNWLYELYSDALAPTG